MGEKEHDVHKGKRTKTTESAVSGDVFYWDLYGLKGKEWGELTGLHEEA